MFNLRLLSASIFLASACAEVDPPTCPPTHAQLRPHPLQVGFAGLERTVLVRAECKRYGATPSSVHVTVHGPSGESVPFTMSEPSKEGENYAVWVTFVPAIGNSIVSAQFEPALGNAEVTLVGMRDRSGEQPVAELEMPSTCWGGFYRAGNLAACTDSRLNVFLDGGLLAEVPWAEAIEAGEVLWSWTEGGVTRWRGADRLELTTPLSSTTVAVSADDERLVLDQDGDLWRFALTDGGLAREPLLLDAGMGTGFFHPPIAVDGGWVWIDEVNHQSCFRGPGTGLSCAPFDSPVMTAEGDGFWVNDGTLAFARFGAGPRPISFVSVIQPFPVGGDRPVLQFGERAVSVRADTMELEVWPAFPGNTYVRPRHVFGFRGSHVTIYER